MAPQKNPTVWIDKQALDALRDYSNRIASMADLELITRAGEAGGLVVKTNMQDLIYGQPALDPYADVAESIQVFRTADNVNVGIVDSDQAMIQRAMEMDAIFPVLTTAFDQQHQTGAALAEFETSLENAVF